MTDPAEPHDPLFLPGVNIHNYAPNQGDQGIFNVTQLPPPLTPMPLDQALALLAELPLDDIPLPQTLPQPHRMPYASNPLFVGREDDLRHIAAQLKASGTVAVITTVTAGIGGVGKTQLAIEAVHRYGRYFGGGVFWLSFANPSGIVLEIAACGRLMGTFHDAEKLELEAQVQKTLARWATDLPCLLIFDNCEDEALLRKWRPTSGGCRVLVTSRKQTAWSPELRVTLLPLEVLARAASVRLLQRLAPRLSDEEADTVAAELGDLPLALHLAGRYLARYSISVDDYLAKLRAVTLRHASLTGRGVTALPTNREPHVERVFALSFERLEADDPIDDLARHLFARAACFAPGEPFGRQWLEATITPEGNEEEQQLARTDAIERLLGLGLLEGVDEDGVRLHRLLAAYATLTLNDADALHTVERVAVLLAYQANETKIPQAMLLVLPHLRYLVQRAQRREDMATAVLCANLGFYLEAVGAYGEAMPLYQRALAIHERVLGANHPLTATSLNNLAGLYRAQGAYERALPLFERALAIHERVLGADHPLTARSLNNLASLYRAQGADERALPLYERALAIHERVLGADHPLTAGSLNNLAGLYRAQGAYERALPLFERALEISERVLGSDHPDTATSLINLASVFQAQGAYERALPLFERALEIHEQVLGADHPLTARSLSNLAVLYAHQGQFALALPLQERASAICQTRLGPTHPDTVQAQESLVALRQRIVVADLPPALRTALEAKDGAAIEQVLQALPPEEAHVIVQQLQTVELLPPADDPFGPLLQAIVAVVQGDGRRRPQIEAVLARLEQGGFHFTAAVQAIWAGERNATRLTQGLDSGSYCLVHHLLTMISDAEAAKRRTDLLARIKVRVAEAGNDSQARADLAERLATVAASYVSGSPEDQALATQLQALISQLTS